MLLGLEAWRTTRYSAEEVSLKVRLVILQHRLIASHDSALQARGPGNDTPGAEANLMTLIRSQIQRRSPCSMRSLFSIGGVLPQVAEDLYPYDQTAWDSDEPA